MQKIVVDILTPKQARFFYVVGKKLEKNGFQVFYTTRNYSEVINMLKIIKIKAKSIGEFGENKLKKAIFSSERQLKYILFLNKIKPELVLSFGSPEAARASFGLGIPHIMANDSPHSRFVMKLTLPLSEHLFSPKCIPKSEWEQFGISSSKITNYNAIDQVVWLKNIYFNKIKESIEKGKFDDFSLVYRPEEFMASYIESSIPQSFLILKKAIKKFYEKNKIKINLTILARYSMSSFYKSIGKYVNLKVPNSSVDGIQLLLNSRVFVGFGGTMNGEAALLGVRSITLSKESNFVEKFLIKKKLLNKAQSPSELLKLIEDEMFLGSREIRKKRKYALKILTHMEDPSEVIVSHLHKILL
ncbi:MAG: DUF354 domain-containing protein [Thermoproteota archaeon]